MGYIIYRMGNTRGIYREFSRTNKIYGDIYTAYSDQLIVWVLFSLSENRRPAMVCHHDHYYIICFEHCHNRGYTPFFKHTYRICTTLKRHVSVLEVMINNDQQPWLDSMDDVYDCTDVTDRQSREPPLFGVGLLDQLS
jgi:hypothetical protein